MMTNQKHKQNTHKYESIEPFPMVNFTDVIKKTSDKFNTKFELWLLPARSISHSTVYWIKEIYWKWKEKLAANNIVITNRACVNNAVCVFGCEKPNAIRECFYCVWFNVSHFIAIYFSYVSSFWWAHMFIMSAVSLCALYYIWIGLMLVYIYPFSKSNSSCSIRCLCVLFDEQKVKLCLSTHS